MATGVDNRPGAGIKQSDPVDGDVHIIMDYSIHDAIEVSSSHMVFIIHEGIEKEFRKVTDDHIASICKPSNMAVSYVLQDINDTPGELPTDHTEPWRTGQAVLVAKEIIKTPFTVVNVDDYYSEEDLKAVHEYLVNGGGSYMVGSVLKNTLSDNGGVVRGICRMGG